jgi:hypothetical protein
MKEIPVIFEGYRLTVVEAPAVKVRPDGSTVTNFAGETQFVCSLFVKKVARQGERAPKGEEIRVTLETDPGEGYQEGLRVALVQPRVSAYELRDEATGRVRSGLTFKAFSLAPGALNSAVEPAEDDERAGK